MILPAEVDDALTALREAREAIGAAVDALNDQRHHAATIDPFTQSHEALSWCVEHVAAAIGQAQARMESADVEERHVECQTFPWADNL